MFAAAAQGLGMEPIAFLENYALASIIFIVSWQWLPFATLILLTALQSLVAEQLEAAEMDGATPVAGFSTSSLPHLTRAITVVILIQTIFLLVGLRRDLVTTKGGPGTASTNAALHVYLAGDRRQRCGRAAAGGIIAVILANIVAFFLMRGIGKNLEA